MYVANGGTGTIGEYTTAGAPVNPALVSGLNQPAGIAVSGGYLYVADIGNNTIDKYDATTGLPVNPVPLVSGLHNPWGLAASGGDLFVANNSNGTIGEYTTAGATVNPARGLGGEYPGWHCGVGWEFVCQYRRQRRDRRIRRYDGIASEPRAACIRVV